MNLDQKIITPYLEEKINVQNDPYLHAAIKDFLPIEIVKKAEEEFIDQKKTVDAGCRKFQKTKRVFEDLSQMPPTIKKIINFCYSQKFINLLERKFSLENVIPDWSLHGGGLHESYRGGFLKIHSDFIYVRHSKVKRILNLVLYLNSNWQKNWGGATELWDKKMKSVRKSVMPKINTAVVFEVGTNTFHGFPNPMNCPENVKRKSIALFYYKNVKKFLPIGLRRRKWYHSVFVKRPNIDEPKFGVDDSFFKRTKNRFFYRFY